MFKRLHIQLTLLCALITGIIIIVMTCFNLYVSEKGLAQNEYGNFLSSVSAIYSHLKTQTNITTEWFSQTENNGQYILYIEDNGVPIKNGNQTEDKQRLQLITEAKATAANQYDIDISDKSTSKVIPRQTEFSFYDNSGVGYYVSAAYIPKEHGSLGVIAMYSLEPYRYEVLKQRIFFAGIDIIAIILLGIFSYFFTQRVLKPVEENRKKQIEFIAAASHELRSPLAVIKSSMSAMKKSDQQQALRFEEIIDSEINRMSRLVNDMLSLAGADNNSWSFQPEETELDSLLINIYEAFVPIAAQKNINLYVDLPDDELPRCMCDKQRIEQVLTILVDNAISYTPAGGKVTLSVNEKRQNLELSVIDTGIGISGEDKKHIFDRFYRADSAHESKEHFGLGLCIAYEIIKLHNGTITVSDTPGGGTTFIVLLNV